MTQYYEKIERINYEGTETKNPFAFRHYNPQQVILSLLLAYILLGWNRYVRHRIV